MGEKIVHMTDFDVPRRGEAPPRKEIPKRGIYASVPKSGGYGYAGTLLSNVGTDYVASFYDAPRDKAREEREISRKLMRGPFRPCGRNGTTMDEGPLTGASMCYTLTKPMPPKQIFVSKASVKGPEAPWRPAGVLPKEPAVTEYREDPYDGYDPRVGTEKKRPSDKVFRPSGTTNSSWYTKSIAFARL